MTCYCSDDKWDVWDERDRTAAKAHRCCECGEAIDPGERYQDIAGLWECEWMHYRTCECCQLDWAGLEAIGHCRSPGWLADTIEEAYS